MPKLELTRDRIASAKSILSKNLLLKSGHLSEALAAGLGHNTHAALIAAAKDGSPVQALPDSQAFLERLEALGPVPHAVHAELAFLHAVGAHALSCPPASLRRRTLAMAGVLDDCVAVLSGQHAWFGPLAQGVALVPDPTVRTLRVDRDVIRWNPGGIEYHSVREAMMLLAAALLHRHLGHPARRGGRAPRLWAIACELPVHDFLITHGVGNLARGGHYDRRHHAGLPAEAVYDAMIARVEPRCRQGHAATLDLGDWSLKGRRWPETVAMAVRPEVGRPQPAPPCFWSHRMQDQSLCLAHVERDPVLNAARRLEVKIAARAWDGDTRALEACIRMAEEVHGDGPGAKRGAALDGLYAYALATFGLPVAAALAKHVLDEIDPHPDRGLPGWRSLQAAAIEGGFA